MPPSPAGWARSRPPLMTTLAVGRAAGARLCRGAAARATQQVRGDLAVPLITLSVDGDRGPGCAQVGPQRLVGAQPGAALEGSEHVSDAGDRLCPVAPPRCLAGGDLQPADAVSSAPGAGCRLAC